MLRVGERSRLPLKASCGRKNGNRYDIVEKESVDEEMASGGDLIGRNADIEVVRRNLVACEVEEARVTVCDSTVENDSMSREMENGRDCSDNVRGNSNENES